MKVELNKDQKAQLSRALDQNNVRQWMLQRETLKFEVGDVLVKHIKRRDYSTKIDHWVVENINSDTKMAQRYVYIYEDEFGIGYIKQLRISDGTLGKELHCMTDFDFASTRFEVDPEYAEHVLLDADFDIKSIHKKLLEARKIITKMNRKIGKKPKTLQEVNDIFDKLKVGDVFWTTSDFTGRYLQEMTITSITKVLVSALDYSNSDWSWKHWKEKNKGSINSVYTYKISYKVDNYEQKDRLATELSRYIFYTTQKPALEEKKS